MSINLAKKAQEELRITLKELVNDLTHRYKNIDELIDDNEVSVSDMVFQTYDTKLIQSYFQFLAIAKSFDTKKGNSLSCDSHNFTTRELVY